MNLNLSQSSGNNYLPTCTRTVSLPSTTKNGNTQFTIVRSRFLGVKIHGRLYSSRSCRFFTRDIRQAAIMTPMHIFMVSTRLQPVESYGSTCWFIFKPNGFVCSLFSWWTWPNLKSKLSKTDLDTRIVPNYTFYKDLLTFLWSLRTFAHNLFYYDFCTY